MRNCDGLTPKEFLFCEEYLIDGNMERAYKKAFPNDSGRNAWRISKRKQVLEYLSKRIQEKQATLSRLRDASHRSLLEKIYDKDKSVSIEASKIVTRLLEVAEKVFESNSKSSDKQIIFNIGDVKKEDNGN